MATPLSTIISEVRTKFEATSTTRWSREDVVESINEGLEELSEDTGFYERWASVPIRDGRVHYDLRGILPDNVLSVTRIWNTSSGFWMTPISETNIPYAEIYRSEGLPVEYWLEGAFWLSVFPKSDADSGYLRIYYTAISPRLTHDQEVVPDLTDEFVLAVEDYALYDLYARDGETNKAILAYKSYQERSKALKKFVENRTQAARTGHIGGRR